MNPPWEQVELKEKEFFATRAPEIAAAPKAADRKRLIAGLAENRPQLYAEYLHTRGLDDNTRLFVGGSGHLDLAAVGGNNFYPLFAELGRTLINGDGGVGAERCRAATDELALEAADLSLEHGLAMADAVVYATARHHAATLVTSHGDFQDLPGVEYIPAESE